MIHRNFGLALSALALSAVMMVAGCDRNNRNASTNSSAPNNSAATSNDANRERERVVNVEDRDLNKETSKADDAKVNVQKEVTRTITSEEKVPTVISGVRKYDINRMTADDFRALGLSQSSADNIIKFRKDHDGFKSIDELSQVPGVSSQQLAPLRSKLGMSQDK